MTSLYTESGDLGFPDDVTVVIIAHNARAHLETTINSLRDAGCPEGQINIVDVASSDGSPGWVKSGWPEIKIHHLESNEGPNPARNVGLLEASTPFVLLMDSDVSVEPGSIPHLRTTISEDPEVAIASPVVVFADKPDTIQYAGTKVHFLCEAVNPWQGKKIHARGIEPEELGCASGNALLIDRSAAIRVGLFDEKLFLGKEDGEFTHRIRIAGYKILEVPVARVHHDCTQRGTNLFYHQLKNRWYFILKNYQFKTMIALFPVMAVHEVLQLLLLAAKGHGKPYLRAVGALWKTVPQILREREGVSKIRNREDWELLSGEPLLVREDMLSKGFIRKSKALYDGMLGIYWNLIKKLLKLL